MSKILDKNIIIIASTSSMIKQFNMSNIRYLIQQGYKAHIACNFENSGTIPVDVSKKFKKELKKMGVETHQVDFDRNPFKIKSTIKAYNQIKKIANNNTFNIMHCHSPIGGVLGRLAFKKAYGCKVIYTAHGFHFYEGASIINWLIYYPIEKLLSRNTNLLITINKEDFKLAQNKISINEVKYVPGIGIDTERFSKVSNREKRNLRKRMGFLDDEILIIMVGELNTNKNQEMVIKNFSQMLSKHSNIRLIMIGKGPLEERYSNLIDSMNLKDKISMLGYKSNVEDYMKISDILISASFREGLPVNIMEGMSVGLPIIASNIRGNRDLVIDNCNGYLFEVNDDNSLIIALDNMIDNNKMEIMSERSYEYSKKYSKESIERHFPDMYREGS